MPPRIANTLDIPKKDKIYARTPKTANITSIFYKATADELEKGLAWYREAHAIADRISTGRVTRGAGVIAALSPMTPWDRNVMLAELAFCQGYASNALGRNCAKANSIMAGEHPLDVLGGQKVLNFFRAIENPKCDAVVIDRHAFDIAVGRVTNDETRRVLGRVGIYDIFARKYVLASDSISDTLGERVSPSQVQAVTWTVWR